MTGAFDGVPGDSTMARSRNVGPQYAVGDDLKADVKLFAPIVGTSTRNGPCPPGRDTNRKPPTRYGTGDASSHRRRQGVVYLIRRTNSPFAKTRKMKKAMKKRKTFHPMK